MGLGEVCLWFVYGLKTPVPVASKYAVDDVKGYQFKNIFSFKGVWFFGLSLLRAYGRLKDRDEDARFIIDLGEGTSLYVVDLKEQDSLFLKASCPSTGTKKEEETL